MLEVSGSISPTPASFLPAPLFLLSVFALSVAGSGKGHICFDVIVSLDFWLWRQHPAVLSASSWLFVQD